jgi:hypothetical protein
VISVTGSVTLLVSPCTDKTFGTAQWYSAGLQAGRTGIRIPARAGNFSLCHRVQIGSGAHPPLLSNGYHGYFPVDEAAEA